MGTEARERDREGTEGIGRGARGGAFFPGDACMEKIRRCIGEVRFGTVTAVIHEGRVVQVEKQEKIRFDG
jgi:hypothetical protein